MLYLPWQHGRALPWSRSFHIVMRKEQQKQYSSQKTASRNVIRRTETGRWIRLTHMMTRTVWKTACVIWDSIHTLRQGMMEIRSGRRCFPVFTPAVKNWIMENGAISVGFCADYSSPDDLESGVTSEYYNWEHSAQYNPDSTSANHAVTIVGWDDSYPKENFSITPPGDGAWIVKNSWSDVWGENGYFYLSYYDTTVREYEGYLADVADSAGYYSYDNNYQYDYMGMGSLLNSSAETESIEKLGEINDSVSVANIFQAEGRESLRAVGVTDTRAWGESVEVVTEIYRLKDGSDPVNGELVSEQTDRIDNLLYTVVELDEPVELEEGEYFSVVQTMRLLTPGSETFLIPLEFGSEAPIYVQGYDAASSYYLNHTVLCGEGQSYIYFSTEEGKDPEWTDLGSEEAKEYFSIPLDDGTGTENSFTVGNAMIKAYTVDTDTTLSISNETLSLICYDGGDGPGDQEDTGF